MSRIKDISLHRKFALYGRVSSDDQRDRETIQNQIYECQAYAPLNNIQIVGTYLDDGISGTIPFHERPEGARLLADALSRKFEGVLFLNHKRIGRTALVIHQAVDDIERKLGLEIIAVREPVPREASAGARSMMRAMYAGVAQYDREDLLANSKSGMERAAREGRWNGGKPPFGYRINNHKLEIDPDQAKIVRLIFRLYLNGRRTVWISQYLTARSIPMPVHWRQPHRKLKGQWNNATVSELLKNKTYIGLATWRKRNQKKSDGRNIWSKAEEKDRIEFKVPAIIKRGDFERVQKLLRENWALAIRNMKRIYTLSKLIKCGLCGRNYIGGGSHPQQNFYYKCFSQAGPIESCGNKAVRADLLEDLIWRQVTSFIKNPAPALTEALRNMTNAKENQGTVEARAQGITRALSDKARQRARLIDLMTRGKVSEEEAEEPLATLRDEIRLLEEEREQLSSRAASMKRAEDSLTDTQKMLSKLNEKCETEDPRLRTEIIRMLVKEIIMTRSPGEPLSNDVEALVVYKFQADNINCSMFGCPHIEQLILKRTHKLRSPYAPRGRHAKKHTKKFIPHDLKD